MPDDVSHGLSADNASSLLDGIDDAFRQVVQGRYGGAVEIVLEQDGADDTSPQHMRVANGEDRLRLILRTQDGVGSTAQGHGRLIGIVTLSPPPQGGIQDVTIMTEIFDDRDPNEASDATSLGTGVLFAPDPDRLPGGAAAGGLAVIRSTEAAAAGGRQARQKQRGWLARSPRQNPSRALGLTTNGHRRSPPLSCLVPVSADLLTRIAGAVAGLDQGGPPIGSMALVVRTGADDMA